MITPDPHKEANEPPDASDIVWMVFLFVVSAVLIVVALLDPVVAH
jgi:hypothetical protein